MVAYESWRDPPEALFDLLTRVRAKDAIRMSATKPFPAKREVVIVQSVETYVAGARTEGVDQVSLHARFDDTHHHLSMTRGSNGASIGVQPPNRGMYSVSPVTTFELVATRYAGSAASSGRGAPKARK